MFVRLGGCNLACSWCDTPHAVFFDERKAKLHRDQRTYDPKVELSRWSPQAIAEAVKRKLHPLGGGLVVFSGGEPMLQEAGIAETIKEVGNRRFRFAIETAGTIAPKILTYENLEDLHFTVSPKLSNSNNAIEKRLNVEALRMLNYACHADFKFVVQAFDTSAEHVGEQIAEIKRIQELAGIPNSRMWLMPEGTDEEVLICGGAAVANLSCANGWNFTQRTHILTWGSERGH